MKLLLILAALLALAAEPATAAEVVKVFAGANGVWYDGPNGPPSDFELGATARASLQPHISLVASAMYGIDRDDLRTTAGFRVTATDVENSAFSIGVGMQYQMDNESEWQGETSLGWKPGFGEFIVGAQGFYGLKSNDAGALVAVRHPLFGFGGAR